MERPGQSGFNAITVQKFLPQPPSGRLLQRMKKLTLLSTFAAAAVLLSGSPAAEALVAPGTSFNFDLAGFNLSQTTGYFLTAQSLTATFGTSKTFTGAGYEGQDISITSSETLGATTTTDTFTVSTPTNFLTDATINGTTISDLELNIGDVNSGGAVAVVYPITSYSATGSVIYGPVGSPSTGAIAPNTMLGPGGDSYGVAEGFNTGSATTPASSYDAHTFTYSITYNTIPVPEPSTWAILSIGASVVVMAIRRRRLAI